MPARVVHWFVSREDFSELRNIVVDPDNIEEDYDVFVEKVDRFLNDISRLGAIPTKVYIKPAELLAWCQSEGRSVNAGARADYTTRFLVDSKAD